jgi:hypothetical protein
MGDGDAVRRESIIRMMTFLQAAMHCQLTRALTAGAIDDDCRCDSEEVTFGILDLLVADPVPDAHEALLHDVFDVICGNAAADEFA